MFKNYILDKPKIKGWSCLRQGFLLRRDLAGRFGGQAAIEMTLAFVAVIIILIGTVRIFVWLNQCLIKRQQEYNATRARAGYPEHAGEYQIPAPALDILGETGGE